MEKVHQSLVFLWNIQLQLLFDAVAIFLKGSSIRLSYLKKDDFIQWNISKNASNCPKQCKRITSMYADIARKILRLHAATDPRWDLLRSKLSGYLHAYQAYKKCSVFLGPSKVMGKIFCHMCMKHTSQVHSIEVPMSGVQARGHFWCSLVQSAPIFEPFLCKYYFFKFLVLNIFCGVNFFLGPVVPWSCGFCRPDAY